MSATLHVESVGAGPDLALIHGWGLHGRIWGEVAQRLAASFTLHIVDLPGHGASPPVPGGWSGWTQALADSLPPTHLLGWSLGGQLALALAALRPAQVRSLTLVATTPRFVAADDWPCGVGIDVLRGFAADLAQAPQATLSRFLALQVRGDDVARAAARALRARLAERPLARASALAEGLDRLATNDLRALVSKVVMPALVISGERDPLVPAGAARWLAAALPNARRCEFPGAAHAPFVSAPAGFAGAIEQFVNELEYRDGDKRRRRAG
ncbi:MAG: pimeloyl-ACP methyl ester esterase BioH [Pseudomonadota bacterium]